MVHNISDETSNIMEIWHDINENKDVGINTCVVEPGNVIKCSTGGDGKYHTTEEYKVTFVLLAFWKDFFSDYYINVSETID